MPDVLLQNSAFKDACLMLRRQANKDGNKARQRASARQDLYRSRPSLAVFDAVASRQRAYESTVIPAIERFAATASGRSLAACAKNGVGLRVWSRRDDHAIVRSVASALVRFGRDEGVDETTACERWATATQRIELAPKLDPYVGCVPGIGLALFNYLRMLFGADAIKPDLRVQRGLAELGLPGLDPPSMIVVARALSECTGIPLVVVDQLLWIRVES